MDIPKTICLIHGLGVHLPGFSKPLSTRISRETGLLCTEFLWDSPKTKLNTTNHREILLSSGTIARDIKPPLPEADLYIGHSLGSLLLIPTLKPKILMGSPLGLINNLPLNDSIFHFIPEEVPTLNIFNHEDPLSAPIQMEHCEDVNFSSPWWDIPPKLSPAIAHSRYWSNHRCYRIIITFITSCLGTYGG